MNKLNRFFDWVYYGGIKPKPRLKMYIAKKITFIDCTQNDSRVFNFEFKEIDLACVDKGEVVWVEI